MRNNPSAHGVTIKPSQADGVFVVTDSEGHDSEFYFLELVSIAKYAKSIIRKMPLSKRFTLWKFFAFGKTSKL